MLIIATIIITGGFLSGLATAHVARKRLASEKRLTLAWTLAIMENG